MDKRTILYITPNFPPLNSSQSISNVYYCTELSKLGYKVIVLASEIPNDHINYQADFRCTESNVTIRRTDIGLYRKFYVRKRTCAKHEESFRQRAIVNTLRKCVKDVLFTPDVFIYWARQSFSTAKSVIDEFKPSIVITASEPNSVHILGARLKRLYPHLWWIGYFGDPWSLEPNLSAINKFRQYRIEKKIIYLMDRYVFTADGTRDLYCKEFGIPVLKTSVFSRGYDPEIYKIESTISLDPEKINFVYSGAIGRQRDITPFLDAVESIKAYLEDKAVFYFVGFYPLELREQFAKYKFIKLPGPVSFNESIMFQKEADFLILLDNIDGIQLPAKAFEYMGTNNPILTFITNDETPLCKLMTLVNRGLIGYNTKDYIIKILSDAITLHEKKAIRPQWQKTIEEFEISNIVRQFAVMNIDPTEICP